jgi:hypothetical protein
MALVAGSVAVDDAGVRTGTGLALARYDALLPLRVTADMITALADRVGPPAYTGGAAIILAIKRGLADECTASAGADIGYLVANTVVTVTTDTTIGTSSAYDALQKTPNPNTVDTATKAPAVAVPLPGTGSGTIS